MSTSLNGSSLGTHTGRPSSAFDQSTRLNDAPRLTFQHVFATSTNGSSRQLVVRSDPSLLTCFDPSDKELYDLWAPQ
ncbi:hypothetical protein L208DRAFT_204889 [Tricholoma matsutake]|nr:hypothetical protein L208DRAFT_204889 [Tricholoma matsutake 945]